MPRHADIQDPDMTVLTTKRLRLEPIGPNHLEGLRRINGAPEVMRHIGDGLPETAQATQLFVERVQRKWSEHPFSWWAFVDQTGDMVGCGPLQHLEGDPARPHEIGWRIRPDRWGCGYAPEAARAIADYAIDKLGLPLVLAVADPVNLASIRVMQKIGMRRRGIETHYRRPCMTFEMAAGDRRAQPL